MAPLKRPAFADLLAEQVLWQARSAPAYRSRRFGGRRSVAQAGEALQRTGTGYALVMSPCWIASLRPSHPVVQRGARN